MRKRRPSRAKKERRTKEGDEFRNSFETNYKTDVKGRYNRLITFRACLLTFIGYSIRNIGKIVRVYLSVNFIS